MRAAATSPTAPQLSVTATATVRPAVPVARGGVRGGRGGGTSRS
jgi:hypothetical protein